MHNDYQLTKNELREQKLSKEEYIKQKKNGIIVILDNPKNLYNVGQIIRTLEAFRIYRLIISGKDESILKSKKVKLSSIGLEKWLEIDFCSNSDLPYIIENLKNRSCKVYAVELTKYALSYQDISLNKPPVVLIFGNEATGLNDSTIQQCDESIYIPISGMANSLNLSISVGIVVSSLLKEFKNSTKEL